MRDKKKSFYKQEQQMESNISRDEWNLKGF